MAKHITQYIEQPVTEDVKRKMVFIGGPRQSGETTLAEHLCEQAGFDVKKRYLTWDDAEERENMMRERFPAGSQSSSSFLLNQIMSPFICVDDVNLPL